MCFDGEQQFKNFSHFFGVIESKFPDVASLGPCELAGLVEDLKTAPTSLTEPACVDVPLTVAVSFLVSAVASLQ